MRDNEFGTPGQLGKGPLQSCRNSARSEHRYKNMLHLWEFLLELLADESCRSIICWRRREEGEFELLNQQEVAKRWGILKQRGRMDYGKLSRALRLYYRDGIITKVLPLKQSTLFKYQCILQRTIWGHCFYVSLWRWNPLFYVVIRATRRSSRSLGKGSNFIFQIFLIKTLTTGPALVMNYTHDLSLCSQARYQLSLSCCRSLIFLFTTWFQVDGQQLCLDRNLLRSWIMCQFTHFIHGRRAHGSVQLDPFMTLQRLEF